MSSTAGYQMQAPAGRTQTPLEAIGGAREGIGELTERLERLVERLIGPRPASSNAATGQIQPTPSGLFHEIREHAHALNRYRSRAFDALAAIEEHLG